jgi:hypothetical protein
MANFTDDELALASRKRSADCPIYDAIKHHASQKLTLLEAQLHRPGQNKSVFILRSPQTKFDECVYTELQRMIDAKGIKVRLMGV